MTDKGSTEIVEFQPPAQCALWEHPEQAGGKFTELFEQVESFVYNSHLERTLYKCRECGHLYFYEWWELVDWEDGNDQSYSTLIPVRTPEEIESLKATNTFGLMRFFPRLHLDGAPAWVGKG